MQHGSPPSLTRHMDRQLTLGFAVLIALMATLIGHATWQVEDIKERMRDIVEERNQKIQLATDLQEASFNRHSSLVYQVLARDAFERDEEFQFFIKWGYQVGKARQDLKAMPLDAFERDSLKRQDYLVAHIIEHQEEITDLASRDRTQEASAKMVDPLRPLNREYTESLESLRRYERSLIQKALDDTQLATQRAITLHATLGAILILLATFIALRARRLLARHATTIHDQVRKLEQAGSKLEHEATHDPLTGLANRVLFYRRLEEAMLHAIQDRFSIAVLFVDLDDFKLVNDRWGHAIGDAMLNAVAGRLRGLVRKSDTAARLGGDEFVLLFVGVEDSGDCPPLCAKVETAVAQELKVNGLTLHPACSIGYAVYPRDGDNLDALLNVADTRMYERKRTRKESRKLSAA